MLLIKLGGSIITDKNTPRSRNGPLTEELLGQLSSAEGPIVLVHGGGSFGHPPAMAYDLQNGYKDPSQSKGIAIVSHAMRELSQLMMERCFSAGLSPVSLPGGIISRCSGGEIIDLEKDLFDRVIDLSLIPMTFGDVAFDDELRFCIVSGDQLMVRLTELYHPSKAIFVTNVDGIYDRDPKDPGAKLMDKLKDDRKGAIQGQVGSDATGGIHRKKMSMLKIADAGTPAYLINGNHPERLAKVIRGEEVIGTIASPGQ